MIPKFEVGKWVELVPGDIMTYPDPSKRFEAIFEDGAIYPSCPKYNRAFAVRTGLTSVNLMLFEKHVPITRILLWRYAEVRR